MIARTVFLLALITLESALLFSRAKSGATAGGLLVVANQYEHTVLLVDLEKRAAIAKITVGINGHEVITSKDGRFAYVPIYGNSGVGKPGTDGSTIDVIDIASHKVTGKIDFGRGVRPHCPLIGPKDGMLYVTTELDQTISIIDPKTLKIVGSIPTGQ